MDLNGDGFNDILSGSYSRDSKPMAGLFQVLWGKADGTFQKAEVLKGTDGEPLLIPLGADKDAWIDCICTRPTAVDWDGDGKLDLITGNFTGTFYLFMGEGKGRFLPKGELVAGEGGPLKIKGNHSDPFLIDWDHDGDLDLLSGSSEGGVQWAENSAGPGKPPTLKPFQTLIERATPAAPGRTLDEADLKGPVAATRIWVDDINSDGKLDILAGDMITLISPAKGLSEEEMKTKSAQWQKEWEAVIAEMNSTANDEKKQAEVQKRVQKLYTERASFIREEMTGFVWLYLQK
ncbi:MAG: VCBS repeat-containing protein [Planctomycetia bacterium]|nr:VCBS repeat-containing protein [Planctomycetia bacterium]